MYNIKSRVFKEHINVTTINLVKSNPYRVFEVDLHGDVSNMPDDEVVKKAKAVIAMEFSPDYGMGEITLQVQEQDEKVTTIEQKVNKQEEKQETILNTMIHFKDLTDEQLNYLIAQYPTVSVGDSVINQRVYNIDGVLYQAIQSVRIDAENWIGDPTIFKLYLAGETEEGREIIHDFVQPTGAHDVYNLGDKVMFDGKIYQSNRDGNSWSPADLPSAWDLVE